MWGWLRREGRCHGAYRAPYIETMATIRLGRNNKNKLVEEIYIIEGASREM